MSVWDIYVIVVSKHKVQLQITVCLAMSKNYARLFYRHSKMLWSLIFLFNIILNKNVEASNHRVPKSQ